MIAQASPAAGPLQTDPSKRVNYTLGLVLGVDEFQQDQLYHAAARRGHDRLLHGYGTVWGLAVTPPGAGSDPAIQVDAGVAVDPCGREICVPECMRVSLTPWLARHRAALEARYPDPTAQKLPLAVVLCHRECPSDTVPVPGEPCRTQEDAMAPSRIRESFELKLALRDDAPWDSPPQGDPSGLTVFRLSQPEEQAVRAFGVLLARVQTTTDPLLSATGEAELLAGVRALVDAIDEDTLASPPAANDDPILLPADDAPRILRGAFRVWVTEVRPVIRGAQNPGVCGDPDADCCVLLAEIDLPLTSEWAVAAVTVETQEDRRPYLLHTRLLQEWLMAGSEEGRPDVDSFATVEVLGPNRLRVWLHHDGWLNLPAAALSLTVNDRPVAAGNVRSVTWARLRNVFDVVLKVDMGDGNTIDARFDTAQVAVVQAPALDGSGHPVDATWTPAGAAQTGTVADELRGPSGEYLDRYGWSLSAFVIYNRLEGGDLRGEYKLPIVAKIQQHKVARTQPQADEYFRWVGGPSGEWEPHPLPDGTRDLEHRYPDCTVRGLQGSPVSPAGPSGSVYLHWNGSAWSPDPLPDGIRDLEGRYPDCTVRGIQSQPVANTAPVDEQYLRFNGGQWAPANLRDARGTDLRGRYPDLSVVGLHGTPVEPTAPLVDNQVLAVRAGRWVNANAGAVLGPAGGDLTGAYPSPTIAKLQGSDVAAATPAPGSFLRFQGPAGGQSARWVPAGLAFAAPSDLSGSFPDVKVASFKGHPYGATAAPASGDVLTWNGTAWVNRPAAAAGGATGPAGGDLGGAYPNPGIANLQGNKVAAGGERADGEVLTWRDGAWRAEQPAPAAASAYQVVAAGVFVVARGQAAVLAPAFGGLLLMAQPDGAYALGGSFAPDFSRFVYVVKAIAQGSDVQLANVPNQQLRIVVPALQNTDLKLEVHVEVSAYPRPGRGGLAAGGGTAAAETGADTLAAADTAPKKAPARKSTRKG